MTVPSDSGTGWPKKISRWSQESLKIPEMNKEMNHVFFHIIYFNAALGSLVSLVSHKAVTNCLDDTLSVIANVTCIHIM